MVCVGLSERDLLQWHDVTRKFWRGHWGVRQNFGGAVAPPGIFLDPPLLPQCEALRTCRSGFPIATTAIEIPHSTRSSLL